MLNLQPIAEDYEQLFAENPLAAEQLKVIVLNRMYGDAAALIEKLQAEQNGESVEPDPEVPVSIEKAKKAK
ncbi:MAG: hypothetical protein IH956_03140 [Chloroflexi bacterium]|nr:hypothetical protein [Chloroflexota bacterium]